MKECEKIIRERLFSEKDSGYAEFQSALMPGVPFDKIIGVRTPILRKYAQELKDTAAAAEFLECLPHKYYEEDNLHAFLIEQIRDFESAMLYTEKFLPYIDNWATCDSMSPKAFAQNPEKLFPHIDKWLKSGKTYTVRFALVMLKKNYLWENFDESYLDIASSVESTEYYVNMAKAWFFAEALAARYEETLPYVSEYRLSEWVHNKTIQKSVESLRISTDKKIYLKTLKIKKK